MNRWQLKLEIYLFVERMSEWVVVGYRVSIRRSRESDDQWRRTLCDRNKCAIRRTSGLVCFDIRILTGPASNIHYFKYDFVSASLSSSSPSRAYNLVGFRFRRKSSLVILPARPRLDMCEFLQTVDLFYGYFSIRHFWNRFSSTSMQDIGRYCLMWRHTEFGLRLWLNVNVNGSQLVDCAAEKIDIEMEIGAIARFASAANENERTNELLFRACVPAHTKICDTAKGWLPGECSLAVFVSRSRHVSFRCCVSASVPLAVARYPSSRVSTRQSDEVLPSILTRNTFSMFSWSHMWWWWWLWWCDPFHVCSCSLIWNTHRSYLAIVSLACISHSTDTNRVHTARWWNTFSLFRRSLSPFPFPTVSLAYIFVSVSGFNFAFFMFQCQCFGIARIHSADTKMAEQPDANSALLNEFSQAKFCAIKSKQKIAKFNSNFVHMQIGCALRAPLLLSRPKSSRHSLVQVIRLSSAIRIKTLLLIDQSRRIALRLSLWFCGPAADAASYPIKSETTLEQACDVKFLQQINWFSVSFFTEWQNEHNAPKSHLPWCGTNLHSIRHMQYAIMSAKGHTAQPVLDCRLGFAIWHAALSFSVVFSSTVPSPCYPLSLSLTLFPSLRRSHSFKLVKNFEREKFRDGK